MRNCHHVTAWVTLAMIAVFVGDAATPQPLTGSPASQALKNYRPVPGRCELIFTWRVSVNDPVCGTPEPPGGVLWHVLGHSGRSSSAG
jgi:hypothetical protein